MNPLRALKNKFVRDSAVLQVGGLLNAIGNLVSSALVAHLIGAHDQGEYFSAAAAYAVAFFALNLGAVPATVSQVAAASARGLSDKVANWLAFLAKAFLVAGVVLVVGGYFVLPAAAERIWGSRDLGVWAWWLCLTPIVDAPRIVCCAAFQATRRMLALAQTENGTEVVRVFLVVAGAALTGSPVGPVLGTLAASAIGSVLAIYRYHAARGEPGPELPGVADVVRRVRAVPLREGLPLGLRLGIMRNIDALALDVLPPLIIRTYGSSAWVTYFRVAQRLMRVPLMFMQGISRTALPAMSALAASKDMTRFRRTFVKTTLLGGGVIAAGVAVTLACVPWLTRVFYPDDYVAPVFLLSAIVSIGYAIQAFSIAMDSFYIVTDRLRIAMAIGVIGIVVTVGSSIVLAQHFPETGAAWGTTASLAWCGFHYLYVAYYFRKQDRCAKRNAA